MRERSGVQVGDPWTGYREGTSTTTLDQQGEPADLELALDGCTQRHTR